MMNADDILQAIRNLPAPALRRLLERAAHELGEAPPESAEQATTPSPSPPDRRRVLGMDVGKVQIAEDFDAPLPDDLQRAFEGEDDVP